MLNLAKKYTSGRVGRKLSLELSECLDFDQVRVFRSLCDWPALASATWQQCLELSLCYSYAFAEVLMSL